MKIEENRAVRKEGMAGAVTPAIPSSLLRAIQK
jgi:hypothetical protein